MGKVSEHACPEFNRGQANTHSFHRCAVHLLAYVENPVHAGGFLCRFVCDVFGISCAVRCVLEGWAMHSDLEGRLEELIMAVHQQNDSCYTEYSLQADDSLLAEQKLEDPGFVPEVQVNPFTEGDEDLRTSHAVSWEESPPMEIAAILHESLLSPSAIQVGAPFVSGFFLVRFLSEWSLDHPCVVITLVTVAFFVLDTFSCELGEEPGSLKSIFAFCRESARVSSFLLVILQLSRDRLKSRRGGEGDAFLN